MGRILETIGGAVTNQASLTAVTMASGDSATLRANPAPGSINLLRIARGGASAGAFAVLSPNLHDNVRGIQAPVSEAVTPFTFPRAFPQPMVSADPLTIQCSGGGAETDAVTLMLEYNNMPNAAGRFVSPSDIKGRYKYIELVEVDQTTTALAASWKDTAINATMDQFHATHDYALIGILSDTSLLAAGIKGLDTGNMRVAIPVLSSLEDNAEAFIKLSDELGEPCIPVFNADNKASTYMTTLHYAAATAVKVTLVLVDMGGRIVTS